MTNIQKAVWARTAYYGDGSLDPRTATCAQHKPAAPYSDTAQGDGGPLPEGSEYPCVVCPLPDADLLGTVVILNGYPGDTYIWAGLDMDRPDWISRSFSMMGEPPSVKCSVDQIAPADTPVDVRDPRITITKLERKRGYPDRGLWLPGVEGIEANPVAMKTKRDALAWAAQRLAIADYHAARAAGAAKAAEAHQLLDDITGWPQETLGGFLSRATGIQQ